MAKRRSGGGSLGFIALFIILTGIAAGAGYWLAREYIGQPARRAVGPSPSIGPIIHKHRQVDIYVLKIENGEAVLVSESRRVPSGEDPKKAALEMLLDANRIGGPSEGFVPRGTRLLGIRVEDDIAYADFSRDIRDNFNGGSTTEALLVSSILRTLAQFKGVEMVQVLVEGKKIDSIGGHIEISEPLETGSTLPGTQGGRE